MTLAEQFAWFDELSTTNRNRQGEVTNYDHPRERWSVERPDQLDLAADGVDCGPLAAALRIVVLDETLTQYRVVLSDPTATFVVVGFKHQPPREPGLSDFFRKLDDVLVAAGSECRSDLFASEIARFGEPPPLSAEVRPGGLTLLPSFGDEPMQVGVSAAGLVVVNYGAWLRVGRVGEASVQEPDLGAAAGEDLTLVVDADSGTVFVNTQFQVYRVNWESGSLQAVVDADDLDLSLLPEVGVGPSEWSMPSWVPAEFNSRGIDAVVASPAGTVEAVVFGSGEILAVSE